MTIDDPRFYDLVQAFIEGGLDEPGRRELLTAVRADPALRAEFSAQVRMAARFDSHLRADASRTADRVTLRLASPRARSGRASVRARAHARLVRPGAWLAAALAAAACLAAAVLLSHRGPEIGARVQTIATAAGNGVVRGADGATRAIGAAAPLEAGDRVSARGGAVDIAFPDGTALALADGAELSFLPGAGKRLRLAGSLSATVAKQPQDAPLVIATAHADITVVGTRFSLSDDAVGAHLVVREGTVRFRDHARGEESLVSSGSAACSAPAGGTALKVLSWNINRGKGGAEHIAAWLAVSGAEVIALQQVPKAAYAEIAARLKQATGVSWHPVWACEGPPDEDGDLLLSRIPPESTAAEPIGASSWGGQRMAARAVITVEGRRLAVYGTYLDWIEHATTQRTENVRRLLALTAGDADPQIVMGGFHSTWDTPWIASMAERYRDAWQEVSGTADGPATKGNRIDYVFVSRGATTVRALRSWVEDPGLSDHKALRCDLLILPEAGP